MLGNNGHNGCTAHRLHRARWEVIRMLKKVITWAIVIFVVYYLATQPTGAASIIHHAYNGLHSAGHSLATFVNSL